jgi:glycerol uptake facilitator-like aquaporin
VTLVFAGKRELPIKEAILYVVAQIAGAIAGTMAAHLMFGLRLLDSSMKKRTGGAQWFAEAVAVFGLVAAILAGVAQAELAAASTARRHKEGGIRAFHSCRFA